MLIPIEHAGEPRARAGHKACLIKPRCVALPLQSASSIVKTCTLVVVSLMAGLITAAQAKAPDRGPSQSSSQEPIRATSRASSSCALPPALATRLQQHPAPQAYAAAADYHGHHQRYACAITTLRKGLVTTPEAAPLLYLLGLNLYAAGQPDQALLPLQQAVQLAPSTLAPHLLLATVLEKLGQPAEPQWQAAYALDAHAPAALDGLARDRIGAGDAAAAITLLTRVPRALVVHDEDLALDLARAYGKTRMLDQAAAILEEAVHLAPNSLRLVDGLETILVLQTHYQAAADLAASYARQHPSDLQAQRLYLRLLVLNHNTAAAGPLAHKLLVAAPDDPDFLYLGGILEREAGDYAAARDHLRHAIELDPNQASARYNLGAALAALHDPSGAREQFEQALKLGAQAPEVRFAYANTLRTLGETDLARQQLVLYQQELKDQQARNLAASKAAQGAQKLADGDAVAAAALYREAAAAAPGDAQLAYQFSVASAKAGDAAGQQAALEQTVALDPSFAIAHYQLGVLASQRNDQAGAEEHFRQAVQAVPAYADAWLGLATSLSRQARLPEARQALASALQLDPANPEARRLQQTMESASKPGQP